MFGPFRSTNPCLGGLLWKVPWRLSPTQKYRQRQRLKQVDYVIKTVESCLNDANQIKIHKLSQLNDEKNQNYLPLESEMDPHDKYTVFSKNDRKYRKGIHKIPKWTRLSQRTNPKGF